MQEGKAETLELMSDSSSKLANRNSRWPRAVILGTWVLFVFSIAMLDWHDAHLGHKIIITIALVGLGTAAMWFFRGGRWIYACFVTSTSLVIAYLLWWIADIADFYAVSPQLGLLSAVELKGQLWVGLLKRRFADGFPVAGLSEFYWLAGMPILQLIVLPIMARFLRQSPGLPQVSDPSVR
jgi:hypothetical protein